MLLALISFAGIAKIVIFLVMLSILVVLHEYGHFLIARRTGVRVNEFAVGMGPKLFGWTSPRSGTLYSVRALPVGGYCAMKGEDGKSTEAEQQREFQEARTYDPDNFQAKTPWQRLGIVVAGPIANFILAYIILLVGALAFGAPTKVATVVGPVLDNSPAQKVGLKAGDRIVAIDGDHVTDGMALINRIHRSLRKQLTIAYVRDGSQHTVNVTPAPCPKPVDPKMGCIGFGPVPEFQHVGIGEAFVLSAQNYVAIIDSQVESVRLLATQFGQYAGQIRGPIGLAQAAGTVQDFGWGQYFQFASLISMALGFFNLFPLPALDGGRGAFIVAELIRGRPVDPEKEAFVHVAGLAALLALMVVVAAHDIIRITSGVGVFN